MSDMISLDSEADFHYQVHTFPTSIKVNDYLNTVPVESVYQIIPLSVPSCPSGICYVVITKEA